MRSRILPLLVVLAPLLAYALWPIDDPQWEIRYDESAVQRARAFLEQEAPHLVDEPGRTRDVDAAIHDASGVPAAGGTARARAVRPNVVLIVADDLGKHDTSIYGPAPLATPNLEQLAADGVRFDAGYVTSPVCSPSRAALLTGRYQQRFGFELLTHDRYPRNRLEWWVARTFFSTHGYHALSEPRKPSRADMERQGIPPSEITLAELLRKHGYRTGIFGKWHLGFGEDMLPEARGFETQYGFYDAFSLYADADDPSVLGVRQRDFPDRYQWWQGRSGGSAIRRDGEIVEEHEYLTQAIAREASAWIEANRDEPFFAYIPFNAPHAPIQAPKHHVDRLTGIEDPDRRIYYGMVAALDDAVGSVLAALDRAGVRDDTIVFFLSDNGAASYTEIVDNLPLNGGKLTNFEGGVKVPFVVRWPARIARGMAFDRPVSALDVFATVAAAAGLERPDDRVYDGVDLLPFVRGDRGGDPHEALYWRTGGHRAARSGRYKLIRDTTSGSVVLFDMEGDPFEKNDLSATKPEIASELTRKLEHWEAELTAPLWPAVMEYRFTIGGRRFVFPL